MVEDASNSGSAPAAGRNYRIAYLDDDVDYAELFRLALARHGHTVVAFDNRCDALAALGKADGRFDAFITDFRLPADNGLEVVREARKRFPALPLAVISSDFANLAVDAMAAGVLAARKPANVHDFPVLLEKVMRAA